MQFPFLGIANNRGSKVAPSSCTRDINIGRREVFFGPGQHYHIPGVKQGGKARVGRRSRHVSDVVDIWRHYDDESVHRVPRDKD